MGSIVTSSKGYNQRVKDDKRFKPPRLLTENQRELVAENESLAKYVVSKLSVQVREEAKHAKLTKADLITFSKIGLCQAARAFDASKGYQFSTYAFKSCYQTIAQNVRRSHSMPHSVRTRVAKILQAKRNLRARGELTNVLAIAKEVDANPSQVWNDLQFYEEVGRAKVFSQIERLGHREQLQNSCVDYREHFTFDHELFRVACHGLGKMERLVLLMRVVEGMTFTEIGKHFGFSRQRADSLWRTVREKIRDDKLKMELLREWMKP